MAPGPILAMMAENKTKPTKVSVATFIAAITDDTKRADAKALVKLMQNESGEKPTMWGPSIIGFGCYHYTYDSGREGDMPLGFAGSEVLLKKLGKHTTGKGCLYIKKLADVDAGALEKLIAKSVAAARAKYGRNGA